MDKVIELIGSWIQQNFKNPKLYAIFAAVIVVIALSLIHIFSGCRWASSSVSLVNTFTFRWCPPSAT